MRMHAVRLIKIKAPLIQRACEAFRSWLSLDIHSIHADIDYVGLNVSVNLSPSASVIADVPHGAISST